MMCSAAPGRGLNTFADLGAGLSYYATGKTLDAPNGYSPGGTPIAASAAPAAAGAPMAAAAASPLKRQTPLDGAQDGGLLTPAFLPGTPGYKTLTGM